MGIGINAIYDATTQILSKYTNYKFSAPVQVLDQNTGKWGTARTNVSLSDGQGLVMRTANPIGNLSILPEVSTYGSVDTKLTINATLEESIRLLEASGYGLSAGPLYSYSGTQVLGTLGSFSAHSVFLSSTTLKPLSLDFSGAASASFEELDAASQMTLAGGVALDSGHQAYVFVPTSTASNAGGTITGEIRLAVNYGTRGCNDEAIDTCRYDARFVPVGTQTAPDAHCDGCTRV